MKPYMTFKIRVQDHKTVPDIAGEQDKNYFLRYHQLQKLEYYMLWEMFFYEFVCYECNSRKL